MLSDGRKALTAIALIFSLFYLNPAPFCILDEVDALLDDVNVDRFCHLVKEMLKEVQFLAISHNKVIIEMADCLVGSDYIKTGCFPHRISQYERGDSNGRNSMKKKFMLMDCYFGIYYFLDSFLSTCDNSHAVSYVSKTTSPGTFIG